MKPIPALDERARAGVAMIRIKAPRTDLLIDGCWTTRRLYTESMHRRVVALVRALESSHGLQGSAAVAFENLRAQAEEEGGNA